MVYQSDELSYCPPYCDGCMKISMDEINEKSSIFGLDIKTNKKVESIYNRFTYKCLKCRTKPTDSN